MWLDLIFAEGLWLLSFVAVAAVSRLLLISTSWSGEQVISNGQPHWLNRFNDKQGDLIALEVGIKCQSEVQWQCQRETSLDRWAKRRGMSREVQTGDEVFDSTVYVFADDEKAAALFKTNVDLRNGIARIIGGGAAWVRCQQGWLIARYEESWRPTPQQKADAAVSVLRELAEAVRQPELSRYTVFADAVSDRAAWWIAAVIAMPVVSFVMLLADSDVIYLSKRALVAPTFALSALNLLLLMILRMALLWGTSRLHRIALHIWWFGVLGSLLLGFAIAWHINLVGQQPPAAVIEAVVLEKKTRRAGKQTIYLIRVDSASARQFNRHGEMPVDLGTHYRVQVGMKLQWKVRQGAFGAPWVESVSIQP